MPDVCSICGREPDEHGLKTCPECGRGNVCCLCLLTTPDAWDAAFDSGSPIPAEAWSCRECVAKRPVPEHLRQTGGHCGCCGKAMPDLVVEKYWPWGLCDKCKEGKAE